MCHERPGRRTPSNEARHGCLDLEEAELVEEAPEVVDDAAPGDEDAARVVGEDEIEVALAVARLLVLEAEVGGGEEVQVRGEEDHVGWRDGELALLGAGGAAGYAYDITTPEEVVRGDEGCFVLRVPGTVEIKPKFSAAVQKKTQNSVRTAD